MFKLLNILLLFLTAAAIAFEPPPPRPADNKNTEILEKIKKLIGNEIPWEFYYPEYSNDHNFELGELVAIPCSYFWDTKGNHHPVYGQIEKINIEEISDFIPRDKGWVIKNVRTEITVSYGTEESHREKKTSEPKNIGKFSQETLSKILANKVTFK